METVRIDKWLWAVRICKTRQIATDFCKRQKVKINNMVVKPSREVQVNSVVTVRRDGIDWQYKVLKCIEKRTGAKIAVTCKEDLTPAEEKSKLESAKSMWISRREKGAGRPTKKERRTLERVMTESQ
ncbi:MAG: RNA-binding S4 domain-containing protein [Deltaproteobacteria bacterium]|nr:RNA-binding S4 domain-containing protein [Deltaproteobacteria bacterium]MBW2660571.1 RNA-binding S4 domain-containing protein [Deltaproteobacteria bacterium]